MPFDGRARERPLFSLSEGHRGRFRVSGAAMLRQPPGKAFRGSFRGGGDTVGKPTYAQQAEKARQYPVRRDRGNVGQGTVPCPSPETCLPVYEAPAVLRLKDSFWSPLLIV